jgi:hypothetical protein
MKEGALPLESPASADRRRAIARGWLADAEVKATLQSAESPSELRNQGRLLGVWVVSEFKYRYPSFQFDDGKVHPAVQELLNILPKGNGSGWSQAEWFYSPHALLGRPPAEIMGTDPDRVIEAARREYCPDADSQW